VATDLARLAAIRAVREGEVVERSRAVFERALLAAKGGQNSLVLLAERERKVLGYGRAGRFEPPPDAPENSAPQGYYLTGLVVAPAHRRRGVGVALTRARFDWIARRARSAWYCASPRNRATIELHRGLGFVEVTRDFWIPGVTFAGGTGILFRVEL